MAFSVGHKIKRQGYHRALHQGLDGPRGETRGVEQGEQQGSAAHQPYVGKVDRRQMQHDIAGEGCLAVGDACSGGGIACVGVVDGLPGAGLHLYLDA